MSRLSYELRNRIVQDITKGISLNVLSKRLDIAKSTLYYYYKKIKGRKYPLVVMPENSSEITGEVVGIFAGDGSQHFEKSEYKYRVNVHFGMKNLMYALRVRHLFSQHFGKQFSLWKHDEKIRVSTLSKKIFQYFHKYLIFDPKKKHYTVRLKKTRHPKVFIIGFLRGFLDTDGSVLPDKGNSIRVLYFTTSEQLSKQLRLLVSILGFTSTLQIRHHKTYKTLFIVRVSSKCARKFLDTIHPFKWEQYINTKT